MPSTGSDTSSEKAASTLAVAILTILLPGRPAGGSVARIRDLALDALPPADAEAWREALKARPCG